MDRNTIKLLMTQEQFDKIREGAISNNMLISKSISIGLKNWYEKNKDRLKEDSKNKFQTITVHADEETEKIFQLYIADSVENLIENILNLNKNKK